MPPAQRYTDDEIERLAWDRLRFCVDNHGQEHVSVARNGATEPITDDEVYYDIQDEYLKCFTKYAADELFPDGGGINIGPAVLHDASSGVITLVSDWQILPTQVSQPNSNVKLSGIDSGWKRKSVIDIEDGKHEFMLGRGSSLTSYPEYGAKQSEFNYVTTKLNGRKIPVKGIND